MRFSLTEEQTTLRDAVRDLLAEQCPPSLLRDPSPQATDKLWEHLAELGLFAVTAPESGGGLGLTVADLVPMLIELGYAAVPLPAAETAVLADLLGNPAIAAGRLRVTIARDAAQVPYAARADRVLKIPATSEKLPSPAAVRQQLLQSRDDQGVLATPAGAQRVSTVDKTRPAARVRLAEPVALDEPVLREAALRYDLALAAQLIGLSRRMLAMTVEYAGQRRQFGAPIGSFQAVKHHLAEALLAIEFAEPAVLAAGWSLAQDEGSKAREVAMAAILATEAAQLVAKTAIQCHGAIGYTVEYDLNLYVKRAWALAAECDIDAHLATIGASLGLETS